MEVCDLQEGLHWLRTAAENGNHCAAYRMGKEYFKGEIVEKDADRAVDCLTQSAKGGNQYAQYVLGKLYLQGKEVGQDQDAAEYWLTQSANQGNSYAQFLLDHRQRNPSVLLCTVSKLMRRIREKKIAMGHKADDHEDYQGPSMSM